MTNFPLLLNCPKFPSVHASWTAGIVVRACPRPRTPFWKPQHAIPTLTGNAQKGLRSANSVSIDAGFRGWYNFYRHQPQALDVPANPRHAQLSGKNFTVTPESHCR
ncbi:protein of unknown function [Paraburkholderia kururiensis]